MPVGIPPVRAHPGKPFHTLRDAAREGQAIAVRCNLCRRKSVFLAVDLIEVCDAMRPAHIAPFACSRCQTAEFMDVKLVVPRPGDLVRRRVWRNVRWQRPDQE